MSDALIIGFRIAVVLATAGRWGMAQDTEHYRTLGPYVLPLSAQQGQRDKAGSEVRQFIWESFKNAQRAKVTVTEFSKEGEPTVSTYSVEPDATGTWRVHVEMARTLSNRRRPPRQYSEKSSLEAYQLRRVTLTITGEDSRPISDSEDITASRYRLQLLSKDGVLQSEL